MSIKQALGLLVCESQKDRLFCKLEKRDCIIISATTQVPTLNVISKDAHHFGITILCVEFRKLIAHQRLKWTPSFISQLFDIHFKHFCSMNGEVAKQLMGTYTSTLLL
jgi:hypothetical protein